MSHVTLQDVVRHSGYSIGTVSRALSGRGSVSDKARKKIQASAEALGYRPDPALSALSAYRKTPAVGRDTAAIPRMEIEVVLTPAFMRTRDRNHLVKGLRKRAEAYGFDLHLSCPDGQPDKLLRIAHHAYHRNVRFIILVPNQGFDVSDIVKSEKRFEWIGLSNSFETLNMHVVAPDHFTNTVKALQHLTSRGAERLGTVSLRRFETSAAFKFSAAALSHFHQAQSDHSLIYPLVVESRRYKDVFREWLHIHDPDTVLLAGNFPGKMIRELEKMAGRRKVRGMYQSVDSQPPLMEMRLDAVGEDAVNLVKQLMLLRLHAVPDYPVHLYVPGRPLFKKGEGGKR